MIVSHARKFVYFHVPKCAGTSFRQSLFPFHDDETTFWYRHHDAYFDREVDYAHMRLWELNVLFPRIFDALPEYDTLALIRNPYNRFISSLAQHLTAFHPDLDYYACDRDVLFDYARQFISNELDIDRVSSNARFVHFSLQTWYVFLGARRHVRHVLPVPDNDAGWADAFSRLGVPPSPVGRSNQRGGPLAHLLQRRDILEWIEHFYKSDFDWLRSEPTLAGLADRPRPAVSATAPPQ